jgi:hypothetical protein
VFWRASNTKKTSLQVNEGMLSVEPTPGNAKSGEPRVYWAGINEQYFLMAAIPMEEEKAFCSIEAMNNGLLRAIIKYPEKAGEEEIALGGSKVHKFRIFIGPKRLNLLENIQWTSDGLVFFVIQCCGF